jgi:hypothetical protein
MFWLRNIKSAAPIPSIRLARSGVAGGGVAVIAENISAMFDHQSLASPRACLLTTDLIPNERGDTNEGSVTNAWFV